MIGWGQIQPNQTVETADARNVHMKKIRGRTVTRTVGESMIERREWTTNVVGGVSEEEEEEEEEKSRK